MLKSGPANIKIFKDKNILKSGLVRRYISDDIEITDIHMKLNGGLFFSKEIQFSKSQFITNIFD